MNGLVKPRVIRVLADYDCYPLWLTGEHSGDLSPGDPMLGLTSELIESLEAWSAEFDDTLCREDPASSGFPSKESEERFYEVGYALSRQLAGELGRGWKVSYFDLRAGGDVEIS
ncbi:hypothetical protein ACFV4G_15350 [Kitasatospora sp. NPDC059747]|uniref:hypothetical protein n=1 Tax=Kitasatospora sp. NPDC059747 TaxID=3346930 RepID=UPI003655965A